MVFLSAEDDLKIFLNKMLAIANLTAQKIKTEKIKAIADVAFEAIGVKKNTEASLVFCGDKKMKNLNKIYRKKDKTTDVLSFSAQEHPKGQKPFILPKKEALFLGEIFISVPEAECQSIKYEESFDRVLARLLIHGILHLAGYDHEKNRAAEEEMLRLQNKILSSIKPE